MEARHLTDVVGRGSGVVGIGIDLVDVDRVTRALTRTPGLTARLFTTAERSYCEAARGDDGRGRRFAARFAAKEAAMKALGAGIGGVGWHDVEVVRGPAGEPSLVVAGRAARLASARGGVRWLVSLTHAEVTAGAFVVLLAD